MKLETCGKICGEVYMRTTFLYKIKSKTKNILRMNNGIAENADTHNHTTTPFGTIIIKHKSLN